MKKKKTIKKLREVDKQIKVFKSEFKKAKLSFDSIDDKDGVLARYYENRMKKAQKQLEKRKDM